MRRRASAHATGAIAFALTALVHVASARAQTSSTPPALTNNHYALEIFQGPVLAPVRVTGIAGAYAGIAEGSEGSASNAAAPAVRDPYSIRWFDYDLDLGISFPGAYGGTDFDNRGDNADPATSARVNSFLHADIGGRIQLGELGISVTTELLRYNVTSASQSPTLSYLRGHALGAYGLFDNQLVLGGGVRIVSLGLAPADSSRSLLTIAGAAPEAGVLWKPAEQRFRVGVTVRAPVSASTLASNATTGSDGVQRASGLILPANVVQPWEIEAGVAVQIGARPLNPRWIDPSSDEAPLHDRIAGLREARARVQTYKLMTAPAADRACLAVQLAAEERSMRAIEDAQMAAEDEHLLQVRKARFNNWPREHILLTASMIIAGESSNAVALEGFLNQNDQRVGQAIAIMPHVGLESEPLPGLLGARTGTYLEASRFSDGHARQHFTFGTDLRLFYFSPFHIFGDQVWRLSGMIDVAPRYSNLGISIGAWH